MTLDLLQLSDYQQRNKFFVFQELKCIGIFLYASIFKHFPSIFHLLSVVFCYFDGRQGTSIKTITTNYWFDGYAVVKARKF